MADSKRTGIERASDAAGSTFALARQLGLTHQIVYRWCKRGFVPPERAMQIHQLYPAIPARDLLDPYLAAIAGE